VKGNTVKSLPVKNVSRVVRRITITKNG